MFEKALQKQQYLWWVNQTPKKKKKKKFMLFNHYKILYFYAKNIWLENQIFWSIRYFLKLLKKFILTQVQIIKPVQSSKCLNFAPRHSPFSMEDVQHHNQASHYQQNRNGQSDDQVDEVLICRCRNKPEMRACQEMNIFHIQLKVWKKKSLRIPLLLITN